MITNSVVLSHVQLFVTLWTIAHQAPLSMRLSRQEYWSDVLYPPAGDLPNPWVEPVTLTSPAFAGRFFTTSVNWEAQILAQESACFFQSLPDSELEVDY